MSRDLKDLLGADEGVVLETRQHWFVVVRQIVVRLLILLVLAIAIWYIGEAGWLDNRTGDYVSYAAWIGFAVVAVTVAWSLLGWITERFYVTTSKIVYASGILNRNVTSTALVKIDEMTLRRPLLGRMLGFGQLDVENASGGHEPLAGLQYLPKPMKLYQLISERARNQRMVEGGAHRDDDHDGLVDRETKVAPATPAVEHADDDGRWSPSGDATS
ncbi:MAG: hypothetical protein JWL76_2360 [Thermoleophilia bacterium]|nr:hypothetical protein [Thermoleophilia bacterium]